MQNLQILYADTPRGYADWLATWKQSEDREPFAHPGYVSLYANSQQRACAAIYDDGVVSLCYPFVLRDLQSDVLFSNIIDKPAFDITSPYGYGGPMLLNGHKAGLSASQRIEAYHAFYHAFANWARTSHVVSEFVRFSLFSEAHSAYYGMVSHNNDNVIHAISDKGVASHAQFKHKVHKNVRQATAHGLKVEADSSGRYLDDFISIYHKTMVRRKAAPFYYFDRRYFERLCGALGAQCQLFHAMHEGLVVASEMVLCASGRIYSFLGGTLKEYFKLRASDLLKYGIIVWAAEQGFSDYVIGGGYRPHDGIFAFKKSFAPQGVVPFFTGKMVFNEKLYMQLTKSKAIHMQGYFPAYRSNTC